MTSKVLFLSAAVCCCIVQSKILRNSGSEIVRGQGFAAPPPGHQSHHDFIQQSAGPARHKHTEQHHVQPKKPVKIISEFDNPGGFQPMKARYSKQKFEPTTEKSFVSGPPLGDDFLQRYQDLLKKSQHQRQQLSFEGLLPEDIIERSKRKHQNPTPPGLHLIKPPVNLDFHSASFENFNFNPNGKWFGEKETNLLQPTTHNIKHRQVTLDYISPSTGEFSPNSNWYGEKGSGFLEYPYHHAVPKRETVYVTNPSRTESKENFSPSGWHVYRNNVIETGTRSSLYQNQDEPSVITIDNVAEYLKQNHHKFNSVGGSPDIFDVNVQAVIKTRDAPNAAKQFYLDG